MADFNVNMNGMLDTADELEIINTRLKSSLDALSGKVDQFVIASGGKAVGSFTSAQQKWDQAMANMGDALVTARSSLLDISERYRLGDNQSAALFDGLV